MTKQTPASPADAGVRYASSILQRALEAIEVLGDPTVNDGLTLTELSQRLETSKSTTVRLMANLEHRGFVERDRNLRYRLSLKLFALASAAVRSTDLSRSTHLYLEDLVAKVGESAYLAVLHGDEAFYIDHVESPQAARAVAPVGSRRPLHATAVGKVLLAGLDRVEAHSRLMRQELPALTTRTLTDVPALLERLELVSKQGYEVEIDEYEDGLTCLGAPVLGAEDAVVAAVGLSGPSWRIQPDSYDRLARAVVNTARSVSAEYKLRAAPTHRRESPA